MDPMKIISTQLSMMKRELFC